MTTTADTQHDNQNEDTAEVPRPSLPQPPHGYAPYGAPGYGQPYGQQPQAPLSAGFAAGFPTPAPRRGLASVSRNTWIAVAAAVTLIVAMVAVMGTGTLGGSAQKATVGGSTTSSAGSAEHAGKLLTAADLPGILLSPSEIGLIVGKPVGEAQVGRIDSRLSTTALIAADTCASMAFIAHQSAFQGTGSTAIRQIGTGAKVGTPRQQEWVLHQAALSYPSRKAAADVVVTTTSKWKKCEGRPWGYAETVGAPRNVFWTGGQVHVSDDGVVGALNSLENGEGWGCWRGMSAVANVVNDFTVCGLNPAVEQLTVAADAIAKKILTT